MLGLGAALILSLHLQAPRGEVVAVKSSVDARAMTHVRMKQLHHGVPVRGGDYLAHYDARGRLVSSSQIFVDHLESIDATPSVTKEAAMAVARSYGTLHDARLVVTERAVLVWEVTVEGVTDDYRIDVDAKTGLIVQKTGLRMSERGSGRGVFGDRRDVFYTRDLGDNVMVDQSRSITIATYDGRNDTSYGGRRIFTSFSGTAWDTDHPIAPGAAVDAAYHVGVTVDFFADTLGRKRWVDGDTEIPLLVHYDRGFENAQYSPIHRSINFGDGGDQQKPLAAFLDIVAHEFTHGITADLSELSYDGESGALNEALSDIFGACVEHSVNPDDRNNWLHGEGSLKNVDGADRDFTDPHNSNPRQPAHMSELEDTSSETDHGNVHANSGIINQAAYLMTMGGTNSVSNVTVSQGIGWDKLAQLFYRLNEHHLNSHSGFKDAAGGTLDAARELGFTSSDIQSIQCAWIAVGVLEGDCDQPVMNTLADDDDDFDPNDAKKTGASKSSKENAAPSSIAPSCSASIGAGRGGPDSFQWLAAAALLAGVARARSNRRAGGTRMKCRKNRWSVADHD